ncbi:hypothetical protein OIV19_20800 [Brucella sp. HL-2]|nr:hypothetical protein [Brucella sp. HL-2]MCV9910041.1 hypothetical protein [Brucella sp. HL-2]
MFCPEGFVPAAWLWGEIDPQQRETLMKEAWTRYEIDNDSSLGPEFLLQNFMRMTPMDSLHLRILFSIGDACFICSPTGQILKLDISSILMKEISWDINAGILKHYLDSGFISEKESEDVAALMQVDYYGYEFYLERIREDIDESGCTNFAEFARKYGWQYSHQHIPLFYERVGFTINFKAFDLFARNDDPATYKLASLLDILRPFEGWAICTKAEYLTDDWRNELIASIKDGENVGTTSTLIGRPRLKRDTAARLYRHIYPHGHNGESWPTVSKKISTQAGYYISTDTIQRAISETGSTQNTD